ncbi:g7336 [Coccomyxa viridis]|uniref:Dolichyl-diphosphooligosaccharide-protein glycosyltransferase subunit OST5 n=1 Tax=Coccomyxa viridis TaxID=1274662 RepID=A0ABP1FXK8_9CHLO
MVAKSSPLFSPIPVSSYPTLSLLLLTLGLLSTAYFFIYESTHSSGMRRLSKELGMTLVSSALLGTGMLFLLLWTGVYV